MAKISFDRWQDRLDAIVRENLQVSLDEVLDVNMRAARAHWKAGHSPREFYDDHIVQHQHGDDFEPTVDI